MIKKIIIIVVSAFLIYLFFYQNVENSVNITEINKHNDTDTLNYKKASDTEQTQRSLSTLKSKQCGSPLFVSDVINNFNQYDNQSLINLLKYFKKQGYRDNDIRDILISSDMYTRSDIEEATIVSSPPVYLSEKVDKALLIQNIKKIDSYNDDYLSLISALKIGELNPNMNLSIFVGHPKTIIEYLLENKGTLPSIAIFEYLIESGVPIQPNTILNALNPNVDTSILSLLIKYLPISDRDYEWNEFLNGGFNYSYASYAAKYSNPKSLKVILSEELGNNSDALNIILKERIKDQHNNQPIDILEHAKSNKNFNQKLNIILEYDIPAKQDLLSSFFSSNIFISEEQKVLLLSKIQIVESISVNLDLQASVIAYAEQIEIAHKKWPEFIFSYDPSCSKIPENSHYRFDNLLEKKELTGLVLNNTFSDSTKLVNQLFLMGDIYVDWYINYSILPKMKKEKHIRADKKNIKQRSVAASIREDVVLGNWSDIEDALISNTIPLSYVYRNNTYLIEVGIEEKVSQNILFNWLNLGVPIHNSSLNELLRYDEYADFTFDLLKQGKLINKSPKSILFQAVKHNNFKLINKLLNSDKIIYSFDNNIGLTPLSWVLLNYENKFSELLKLLLNKETIISTEQKLLIPQK